MFVFRSRKRVTSDRARVVFSVLSGSLVLLPKETPSHLFRTDPRC